MKKWNRNKYIKETIERWSKNSKNKCLAWAYDETMYILKFSKQSVSTNFELKKINFFFKDLYPWGWTQSWYATWFHWPFYQSKDNPQRCNWCFLHRCQWSNGLLRDRHQMVQMQCWGFHCSLQQYNQPARFILYAPNYWNNTRWIKSKPWKLNNMFSFFIFIQNKTK